jgi:hypothetical protein
MATMFMNASSFDQDISSWNLASESGCVSCNAQRSLSGTNAARQIESIDLTDMF